LGRGPKSASALEGKADGNHEQYVQATGGSVLLDFARVTEWISPRLRRPATWVWVTLGVALSGATAHFLQSRISAGFEHAADASTSFAKEMWCQHRNASIKLSDDRFTILVSPLQGDPKDIQTEEMYNALIGELCGKVGDDGMR
jgi:HAMP domain-containing protein